MERILELMNEKSYKELKQVLLEIHAVDLALFFEEITEKQILILFRLLNKEDAAETFTHMESDSRERLIAALNEEELRDVMEELYLDDTVDILEELPANVVNKLLASTDDQTRTHINELLQYPEDSAGSIMTIEYIRVNKHTSVAAAIKKIRQIGLNKETIYSCYVTERKRLIAYVALKDLLAAKDEQLIEEIMDENVFSVQTTDDQEYVAKITRKYGLFAVPVVDKEQCLVGIVTVDDAMGILQEEATEDINKMAAMLPMEDSYFETSVWQHAMKRIPWLLFLMLSATITGIILNSYNYVIALFPIAVSFIPMLMGTGGNCGSQAASLVIRGLAVDELKPRDALRIFFVEVRIAVGVGMFLAVINGIRIYFMYQNVTLALLLGVCLILTILLAKLIGAMLPILALKVKLDPAIMAAPLITTIVDSCSMLIYFMILSEVL